MKSHSFVNLLVFAALQVAESNELSDVQKYVEEWRTVSVRGDNGLVALEKISKSAKHLVELGRPIANLIAAGVDVTWTNESVEQRAIGELHNYTITYIASDCYRNSVDLISGYVWDMDFFTHVFSRLNRIGDTYDFITSQEFSLRKAMQDDLEKNCFDLKSILEDVVKLVKYRCTFPDAGFQSRYLQIVENIHEIEYAFKHGTNIWVAGRKWARAVFDLKARVHIFSDTVANSVVDELRKARGSPILNATATIRAILCKYPARGDYHSRLASFFDGGDHKREILFDGLLQLAVEFRRVLIFTSACSNLTTSGQVEVMDRFENDTVQTIVEMADYAIEWTKQALYFDWPTGPSFFIKHALRKAQGLEILSESYNNTAEFIKKEFDARGSTELIHQVLVSRPMSPEIDYHLSNDDEKNHTVISDFFDIDAHIFRFNSSDKIITRNTSALSEEYRKKIIETFKVLTKDHSSETASKQMEWIIHHNGLYLGNKSHEHAILFSTKAFSAEKAILHTGEAFSNEIRGFEKVELYQHFPFYNRDFSHKLYWLV